MNKRPISVIVISLLLAAAGAVGFVYHLRELNVQHPFQNDFMWIEVVRLLAVVCGVFMLRGQNWARWLAVIWLGFHVAIGVIHSLEQFAFHAVLFGMIAYILFRRPEADYFRSRRAEANI
jgi:hypothetical protein